MITKLRRAGVHPQYVAEGVTNLNCTLRLFLIEGNAADEDLGRTLPGGAALGKDSDEQLVLKAGQSIVYQRTLSNALGTFVEGKLTLILTLILTRTRTLSLTPILTRTRTLILARTRTLILTRTRARTRQAHRAAVGRADRGGQPHRHVGLPPEGRPLAQAAVRQALQAALRRRAVPAGLRGARERVHLRHAQAAQLR